jgi:protoheme IX farnesyltransferase
LYVLNTPQPDSTLPESPPDKLRAYYELTKPRITLLVLISMAIGFLVATPETNWLMLLHACLGTWFIASGTSAFNQYIERDLDKLMFRTMKRPLPTRKVPPAHALVFSMSFVAIGLAYLTFMVNTVAGIISGVTTLIYLLGYTPLKKVSFLNLYVGAIPGALPPVGGWAAATGTVADVSPWALFAIVFLWQIPHVTAIAWMYLEDYQRADFEMIPNAEDGGKKSALISLAGALLLFPVSFLPVYSGLSSLFFGFTALAAAFGYFWYSLMFFNHRTKEMARTLLFASIFYLPSVWGLLLVDHFFFR